MSEIFTVYCDAVWHAPQEPIIREFQATGPWAGMAYRLPGGADWIVDDEPVPSGQTLKDMLVATSTGSVRRRHILVCDLCETTKVDLKVETLLEVMARVRPAGLSRMSLSGLQRTILGIRSA